MELERLDEAADEYVKVPIRVFFTITPPDRSVGIQTHGIEFYAHHRSNGDPVTDLTSREIAFIEESCLASLDDD